MAASSSPWPRPRTTRFTCNWPLARTALREVLRLPTSNCACLLRVNRIRLVGNLDRCWSQGRPSTLCDVAMLLRDLLRAKSRGCTAAAPAAASVSLPTCRHAAAEIALATVPLIPFAPPDPLPCPGPTGISNEPAAEAISLPFGLLFTRLQSIWIAETASLHFLNWSVHCRWDGTSLKIAGVNHDRARTTRGFKNRRSETIHRYFGRLDFLRLGLERELLLARPALALKYWFGEAALRVDRQRFRLWQALPAAVRACGISSVT